MTTTPPTQQAPKFSGLAWAALILGIVGIVGSPIILLNNVTAIVAAVGVVLGLIALFGTRKVLAGIGVALSVLAIVFTVLAQGDAVEELEEEFGGGEQARGDVTVSECAVVDDEFGLSLTQATIAITNSDDQPRSYSITLSVNSPNGDRLGEINAFSNSLASGQSTTLSGVDASGPAPEGAQSGPVECTVANVDRF